MQGFSPDRRRFTAAGGNYLIDAQRRRFFDAVSSIWTTIHGHSHPKIVEAIARQAAVLDHATLLGATHPLAEELAARLCDLLGMDFAFFASDGASAVEAAIKMAIQFWQESGEPHRTRFVHLVDAYHGDTAGAMSLSGIQVFKSRFGAVSFETIAYDSDPSILRSDDVAAVMVEPIVQAAAGMRIVPAQRYSALIGISPLLIVDEIATGFGRTGTLFAHEQLSLQPDIVCLGKGLSGGTLPLSATVVRSRIYDAFTGEPAERKQFFHGHSYAGNPIACAAALANIDLFASEGTLERVQALARHIAPTLQALGAHRRMLGIRQAGLMIGLEVDAPPQPLTDALYDRGHFTRPIGNVIQLVPPLSSTAQELEGFVEDLRVALS